MLESESELESGFLMQPGIGIGIKDCRNRASLVCSLMNNLFHIRAVTRENVSIGKVGLRPVVLVGIRVVFLKVHVYVGAHLCYRGLVLVNKIFY